MYLIEKLCSWFVQLTTPVRPDPVDHCDLYKTTGCPHVDSYSCDIHNCVKLQEHLVSKQNRIKNMVRHTIKHPHKTPWRKRLFKSKPVFCRKCSEHEAEIISLSLEIKRLNMIIVKLLQD